LQEIITGGQTSTTALAGSTEAEQFTAPDPVNAAVVAAVTNHHGEPAHS
jgi:hypothetical protein